MNKEYDPSASMYSPYGGAGMKQEWIDNMNSRAKDFFKYNVGEEINPKTFLLKYYTYLNKHYEFRIDFEYLGKRGRTKSWFVCRPTLYIGGEFIVGFNWCANYYAALQQMMIHFLNNVFHKLFQDKECNYSTTAHLRDKQVCEVNEFFMKN